MFPSTRLLKILTAYSAFGVLLGLLIFASFGFQFKNWDCAVWGLASGVFAAFGFIIHVEYRRNQWQDRPALLTLFLWIGVLGQLASVSMFATYIALAVVQQQGVTPYNKGYYVSAVWCFMTWKWSFFVCTYSCKYRRLNLADNSNCVNSDPSNESSSYQQI